MKRFRTDKKVFDALKFKEVLQSEVRERTKDMTTEERLSYLRKRPDFEPFSTLWDIKNKKV